MADTRQVVRWSLARACGLRSGDAACETDAAFAAVSRAATFADCSSDHSSDSGLFRDVCVTSRLFAQMPLELEGKQAYIPHSGFLLPESFRDVGGVDGLIAMCRACPANANNPLPAGCVGTIFQYPESAETQEQLEAILSRLGLIDAYADAFLPTTPIWYGLWARSPMPRAALRILHAIFAEMYAEDEIEVDGKPDGPGIPDHLPDLRRFIGAIERAERHGLALHVALSPLGHTDLGFYTIFPHCPICKATAHLERWRRSYPTALYTCTVCGTQFPPAETASSERDSFEDPDRDLKVKLGDEFPAFAKSFIVSTGGFSASEADEILATSAAWERDRQAKFAADQHRNQRHQRYIRSVVYAGLHPNYRVDVVDEDDDEDDEPNVPATKIEGESKPSDERLLGTAYFNGEECEQLLLRCKELGYRVTSMMHSSKNEDLSRATFRRLSYPLDVFAKWQAEGCNEWFCIFMSVPDAIVQAWEASQQMGEA